MCNIIRVISHKSMRTRDVDEGERIWWFDIIFTGCGQIIIIICCCLSAVFQTC